MAILILFPACQIDPQQEDIGAKTTAETAQQATPPSIDELLALSGKAYQNDFKVWQNKRVDDLKHSNSFMNLVGLFWLKEGTSTFGSGSTNDFVFPTKTPAEIGTFILEGETVRMEVKKGAQVFVDEKTSPTATLFTPELEKFPVSEIASVQWFVIKRGKEIGIRVRDADSGNTANLQTIERFPVNETWRVSATFSPYAEPKIVANKNVLDIDIENTYAGVLDFELEGKPYQLYPTSAGSYYYVRVADETTGESTYEIGRYLDVPTPDEKGKTILDFNRLYNPPCAFSKYATCPLPTKENTLDLAILVGEKSYKAKL
ncbi:MAG: DUF1684 domain-containing protein [Chitinophagales bacterium]